MTIPYLLGGALAVVLVVYLFVALLRPALPWITMPAASSMRESKGSTMQPPRSPELFVAGRFAHAGSIVRFISRDSHEFQATRNGVTVAVEVQSAMTAERLRARNRDVAGKFFHQRRRKRVSSELRRYATMSDDGRIAVLALEDQPLGIGTAADQVRTLIGKKKPAAQLRGAPNPLLVMSFWHKRGVGRTLCQRVMPSGATGLLYAAAYGRKDDQIVDFDTASECWRNSPQPTDGILVRSKSAAALAWLFQSDAPVLFENLDRRTTALSAAARRLVRDAFGIPTDALSRLRSPR